MCADSHPPDPLSEARDPEHSPLVVGRGIAQRAGRGQDPRTKVDLTTALSITASLKSSEDSPLPLPQSKDEPASLKLVADGNIDDDQRVVPGKRDDLGWGRLMDHWLRSRNTMDWGTSSPAVWIWVESKQWIDFDIRCDIRNH